MTAAKFARASQMDPLRQCPRSTERRGRGQIIRAIHRGVLAGVLVVLAAACARQVATPTGEPSVTVPEAPVSDPNRALRLNMDPNPVRYRVETRTLLYAQNDTTTPLDSVLLTAVVRLGVSNPVGQPVQVRGTVESLSIRPGGAAPTGAASPPQSLQSPITFDWSVTSAGLTIDATGAIASDCDELRASARDLLVSLVPLLPDSLAGSGEWRYTTRLASCRAGVDMEVVTEHALHATELDAARRTRRVPVISQGSLRVTGQGKQGASDMTIRGSGTTTSNYVFDLGAGRLQSSQSMSTVRLEFDLGYRTDRIVQKSARTVTRM